MAKAQKMKTQTELLDIFKDTNSIDELKKYVQDPRYINYFNNKNFILSAAKINKEALSLMSSKLQNDTGFVNTLIKAEVYQLKYASKKIRENKELVMSAIEFDPLGLFYADEKLKADREIVFNAGMKDAAALKYANKKLLQDIEVVYPIVKKDWKAAKVIDSKLLMRHEIASVLLDSSQKEALDLVPDKLIKHNRDVASKVVGQEDYKLKSFSRGLKKDGAFVELMIRQDVENAKHMNSSLKKDVNFGMEIVALNPKAYEYFGYNVQINKQVASIMVNHDGTLLKDITPPANRFIDVCLDAVSNNPEALQYVRGVKERYRKEIVEKAITSNGYALKYAKKSERTNKSNVLDAINACPRSYNGQSEEESLKMHPINYAGKRNQKRTEVMLASVENNGLTLQFAHDKIKKNHPVALAAVRQNGLALQYVNPKIADDEIVYVAVEQNPKAIEFAGIEFLEKSENRDYLIKAIIQSEGEIFARLPQEVKEQSDVIIAAAKYKPEIIKEADLLDFRSSKEYAQELYMVDPKLINNMSLEITQDKELIKEFEQKRRRKPVSKSSSPKQEQEKEQEASIDGELAP